MSGYLANTYTMRRLIVIASVIIAFSSCKTTENTQALSIIDYYEELDCENCDEID